LPVLLGIKVVMVVAVPLAAMVYGLAADLSVTTTMLLTC